MGTVSTAFRGGAFTRHDLDRMPDDGRRHEIIDGLLVVTPAPSLRHQWVSSSPLILLDRVAPHGFKVPSAPLDIAFDDVRGDGPIRPLLVVEILSPSTRRIDLTLKRSRCEAAGCPSYWVVDPDAPSVAAWELVAGAYEVRGQADGEVSVSLTAPFDLTLTPARLVE